MSNLLYNEVSGYKVGDWKTYARHTNTEIAGFFGEYQWLSNFHESPCEYEGTIYPSVECAYQAAKYPSAQREYFKTCTPAESKKYSRNHPINGEEWDRKRLEVMVSCIRSKFNLSESLTQKLLDTGEKILEETNHWKDTYWGVYKNKGQNMLGKLLMSARNLIRLQTILG